MLGLGFTETIVLAGIILVVMGPEKFPEVAKVIMRTVREFRGYWEDAQREITKEINPLRKELNTLTRYKPEEFIDHFTATGSKTPEELDPTLADASPSKETAVATESATEAASTEGAEESETAVSPAPEAGQAEELDPYRPQPYTPGGLAAEPATAPETAAPEATLPSHAEAAQEPQGQQDAFDDLHPPERLEG